VALCLKRFGRGGDDCDRSTGQFKAIGGSKADEWNKRLNELTVSALPMANSKDTETFTAAALAVAYCTMDIAPADPTEGMLISQLSAPVRCFVIRVRRHYGLPPHGEFEVVHGRFLGLFHFIGSPFLS
jgi:hypothetical protein